MVPRSEVQVHRRGGSGPKTPSGARSRGPDPCWSAAKRTHLGLTIDRTTPTHPWLESKTALALDGRMDCPAPAGSQARKLLSRLP